MLWRRPDEGIAGVLNVLEMRKEKKKEIEGVWGKGELVLVDRNVGDVGTADVIGPLDLQVFEKIGINPVF